MADGQEINILEINPSSLTLFEKVGTGCTAEVFRGTYQPLSGEPVEVAVKQIDWNKSNMGQKEQRAFDREVAIMPRLKHGNLVLFHGVTSLERPFRIITEYCSGGCCFELLHNCDHIDLNWCQQIKMCSDVAQAMRYLHSFNPMIIHRDLKSLNLLLASPIVGVYDIPLVKVSDFGLSRMKDAGADKDWGKMTIAAGTCHWMAPEVYMGGEYDEKVDVYSYAMILFEIICREIPFEDEEPCAVGRLTVQGQRPDMEAVPPDCPRELYDLMVGCWASDPKTRPAFDRIEHDIFHVTTLVPQC
jgi:serine/threonine protein kinase